MSPYVWGKHTFKIGFDGRKYISPQGFTQRFRGGDYEYTGTRSCSFTISLPTRFGFGRAPAGTKP